MTKYKWYVTGRDNNTMQNKTVLVTASNKQEAIKKGMQKIKSNIFIHCELKKI